MAGKEKMRVSDYKKNRTKIEPESKEYQEIRKMEEENIREIPKDMAKNALRLIGMKSGGRVAKYAGGGMKKADMTQRRQKTKQLPKPVGRKLYDVLMPSYPGQPVQVPRPASKRPGTNSKTKMGLGPRGKMNPRMAAMAGKAGLKGAGVFKHGGDVYTTPGGPTRGKSGKIKKMAAGGMIPKAGKKSPNSMGTSYRSGGAIDGCAMRGRTRAKRVK